MHGLLSMGVSPGQSIMLHVSLRAIGWIVGGPDVLIQAMMKCLGDQGTLMMYAGWEERPEHFERWPIERQEAFLAECPPFDPERSRANRKWSTLTEYLRTWPGACRSQNPGASMVALGAKADWLTRDHALQYGYGLESPLAKLCEIEGWILQIGVSPGTATIIHHAEHLAKIPKKRIFKYRAPILEDQQTRWIEIEEFDTSRGAVEWEHGDYLEQIAAEFRAAGKGRMGIIGVARSYLCKASELRDFAVNWLETQFGTPHI